ncbi:unnamed protein product [Bursaphelenchus okinawaensis]|uniref:Uncharacterized protein n=1 Tax=Bursaphelenchus okinawaensis TaxID=465554 RepID=A0A811LR97_9BILA|nr:unnamed protein product [Bursaphelenchus okinawaensis]CAG9128071.1 unnamed protein product [Bursaphelenchus okinawaensis]
MDKKLLKTCLECFLEHNLNEVSRIPAVSSTEHLESIFLINQKHLRLLNDTEDNVVLIIQRTGFGIKVLKRWMVYIPAYKLKRLLAMLKCSSVKIDLDTDGLGHFMFRNMCLDLVKALNNNSFIKFIDLNLVLTITRTGKENCLVKAILFEVVPKIRSIYGFSTKFLPLLSVLKEQHQGVIETLGITLNSRSYLDPLFNLPVENLRIHGDLLTYLAFEGGLSKSKSLKSIEIEDVLETIGLSDCQEKFVKAMQNFKKDVSEKEKIFKIRGAGFYEYGSISDLFDSIQINLVRANRIIELATGAGVVLDSIIIVGAATLDDIIMSEWKQMVKDYIEFNFIPVKVVSKDEHNAVFTVKSHTGTLIEFRVNCTEAPQLDD